MAYFKIGKDPRGNRIIQGVSTGERAPRKVAEFDESDLDQALAAEDAALPAAGAGLPCQECDFIAGSAAGLEAHRAAHHSAAKSEIEAALEEDVDEDDDADLKALMAEDDTAEESDEIEAALAEEDAEAETDPAAAPADDDLG